MSIAEVRNEIVKFATYARASESNGVTIGAGTLEYWADKLGHESPVSLQPSVESIKTDWTVGGDPLAQMRSLHAKIMAANQEGLDSRQPTQACENCLYTGKLCPECLTEWERANREV